MNEDHDRGARLSEVNGLFDVFAWPSDGVTFPTFAGGIWNKNDLSNQETPPRAWCTCADQNGRRLQAILREKVPLHLSMQVTEE